MTPAEHHALNDHALVGYEDLLAAHKQDHKNYPRANGHKHDKNGRKR